MPASVWRLRAITSGTCQAVAFAGWLCFEQRGACSSPYISAALVSPVRHRHRDPRSHSGGVAPLCLSVEVAWGPAHLLCNSREGVAPQGTAAWERPSWLRPGAAHLFPASRNHWDEPADTPISVGIGGSSRQQLALNAWLGAEPVGPGAMVIHSAHPVRPSPCCAGGRVGAQISGATPSTDQPAAAGPGRGGVQPPTT